MKFLSTCCFTNSIYFSFHTRFLIYFHIQLKYVIFRLMYDFNKEKNKQKSKFLFIYFLLLLLFLNIFFLFKNQQQLFFKKLTTLVNVYFKTGSFDSFFKHVKSVVTIFMAKTKNNNNISFILLKKHFYLSFLLSPISYFWFQW